MHRLTLLSYNQCYSGLNLVYMRKIQTAQFVRLFLLIAASLAIAFGSARHLARFADYADDQSYILLVPALTAMLIYRDQDRIFSQSSRPSSSSSAVGFFAVGGLLIAISYALPAASEAQMAVVAIGLISWWVGSFIYCFGVNSAKAATFPLGMLLWIIPIPAISIDKITTFLQVGSTELVAILFRLTGTTFLREGFVFNLSTETIEVARECSGIRSSLCLIILTLVIAHETLRGNWRRALLVILTVPLVILKNGIRIVTLTLLAIHVDPSFLRGSLHHKGGIVFFLVGMALLVPLIALLRRGDGEADEPIAQPASAAG